MKKVLVVDDDTYILHVMGIILDMEGYEVHCADDGNKVSDIVLSFLPDLILLDIWLGNLDGRDVCKKLKSDPTTEHIPIIMVSASHNLKDTVQKVCNADDFIAKPFEIIELVAKVEKYTSQVV